LTGSFTAGIYRVEGGELFLRVSEDHYILTEMAVAMIVYQICQAISYIHSQNIIHLDLKVTPRDHPGLLV